MVKTELSLGLLVSFSFFLLIGIDDRKFLPSCDQ